MQQKEQTDRGTLFGWNVDICTRVWDGESSIMTEMLCERREGSDGWSLLSTVEGPQVPYANSVTLVAVSASSGSRPGPSSLLQFVAGYETKPPGKYLCRGGEDNLQDYK